MTVKLLSKGTAGSRKLFVKGTAGSRKLVAGADGCVCCPVGADCAGLCQSGTSPLQYLVKIRDVANDACALCGAANGDFVVDQVLGSPCFYRYELPTPVCRTPPALHYLELYFLPSPPYTNTLYVSWSGSLTLLGGHAYLIWGVSGLAIPLVCSGISDLDIPFLIRWDNTCQGASSTCKITAL